MSEERDRVYEDPTAPVADRVTDLIERMTIEEKIGQTVGMYVGDFSGNFSEKDYAATIDDAITAIRDRSIGSVTPFGVGVSRYNRPNVAIRISNWLQQVAVEDTRLGIPINIPVDAVHGHANVVDTTIFPHNLGLAATWNPELVQDTASITAKEMRATGATQTNSPAAGVARDQRWARTYETYGESPYLVSQLVAAEISGLEDKSRETNSRVAATVKNFPAFGSPVRGEHMAPVDISPRALHRIFLPPFRRAIDSDVTAVMAAYNSVNREPVHGSHRYLTELLRDELGFEGVTCSDWWGVDMLEEGHETAETSTDAVRTAWEAGIDLFTVGGPSYVDRLRELFDDGSLSESLLDQRTRRILEMKFQLGLFEDPYIEADVAVENIGCDAHRRVALKAARQSITLLQNDDGVLPLETADEILVTGPNARTVDNLCGGWTVADLDHDRGTTVIDGITEAVDDPSSVTYTKGASIDTVADEEAVQEAASTADAAVVVLGEDWYVYEFGPESINGPTGEFPTRTQLAVPDAQQRLLETVAKTGIPTVLVLVSGRPLAITDLISHADATVMAYLPGPKGGRAVADVLFGNHNPSGKLPVSMPKSVGELPCLHDCLSQPVLMGENEHPSSYDPLFRFGHGESYSSFTYESMKIDTTGAKRYGHINVAVDVTNTSARTGTEVVQLFMRNCSSSQVTPRRELKAFSRVTVPPGETTTVRLTVNTDDLAVTRSDGIEFVEHSEFMVYVDDLSERFSI
ncbi:glycoside hydrolase family 3 N-terminal domain-containing protein [Natrinema sp. 74]|uniref:glycoside hydrolase family 3 N-terminal domain-containing protein n=1 Tax=Natrinema sp. 74 TaxID=3384159 RepID=UPI0038D45DC3